MKALLSALGETFRLQGTSAVAEKIQNEVESPEFLKVYRTFTEGKEVQTVTVKAHPNEAKAFQWMNHRLKRMGLAALKFESAKDRDALDITAIDTHSLKLKKWMRYLAGPGVAVFAMIFSIPHDESFGLKILPPIAVGLTSVLLEIQFAWPWINNLVWKRLFKFGGEFFSPITMWTINFVYALLLYAAGFATAHAPELLGGAPIPFPLPPFGQALLEAAGMALVYTVALGIFQSDVAREEERGSITANQWYGLETTGIVITNSARVAKWVVPNSDSVTYFALGLFFVLKTVPQFIKIHFADRLADREVYRAVDPERAPEANVFERFALTLGGSQLFNLPRLIKERRE